MNVEQKNFESKGLRVQESKGMKSRTKDQMAVISNRQSVREEGQGQKQCRIRQKMNVEH